MEPEITSDTAYLDKQQEKAIILFYKFLLYKQVKVDGDVIDDFFNWYLQKKEELILLEEMDALNTEE
jgi:hypothetical protein